MVITVGPTPSLFLFISATVNVCVYVALAVVIIRRRFRNGPSGLGDETLAFKMLVYVENTLGSISKRLKVLTISK